MHIRIYIATDRRLSSHAYIPRNGMKVGDYLFASRTSNRLIMLVVVSIIRISNGLARHHFRNDGTREEA